MGTTPGGLPYPEPTDPIAQGANAIRALAEAVDALWNEGALAIASGWTLRGYSGGVWRMGRLVVLNAVIGNTSGATSAANPQVATLPIGFRPSILVRAPLVNGATAAALAQVTTAGGLIAVTTVPNGTDVTFNLSFPASP